MQPSFWLRVRVRKKAKSKSAREVREPKKKVRASEKSKKQDFSAGKARLMYKNRPLRGHHTSVRTAWYAHYMHMTIRYTAVQTATAVQLYSHVQVGQKAKASGTERVIRDK